MRLVYLNIMTRVDRRGKNRLSELDDVLGLHTCAEHGEARDENGLQIVDDAMALEGASFKGCMPHERGRFLQGLHAKPRGRSVGPLRSAIDGLLCPRSSSASSAHPAFP
jgi:hypothetical protein